jgi:hypothetical protein
MVRNADRRPDPTPNNTSGTPGSQPADLSPTAAELSASNLQSTTSQRLAGGLPCPMTKSQDLDATDLGLADDAPDDSAPLTRSRYPTLPSRRRRSAGLRCLLTAAQKRRLRRGGSLALVIEAPGVPGSRRSPRRSSLTELGIVDGRDGSDRKHKPDFGNNYLTKALSIGKPVVGIAAGPHLQHASAMIGAAEGSSGWRQATPRSATQSLQCPAAREESAAGDPAWTRTTSRRRSRLGDGPDVAIARLPPAGARGRRRRGEPYLRHHDKQIKGFIMLPKRRRRTFGWINRASRFAKDFEGDHRIRARLAPHSPPDFKVRPAIAHDWQKKSDNWPKITGTTSELE